MDSFYGGKPGISFIIKDKFDSIEDMEFCFQYGYYPNKNNSTDIAEWTPDNTKPYDKIWYNEYCIIDTPNKNNIHNGKVFRRTAMHAATSDGRQYSEYVGQIVGPAGGIPYVELENINTLKVNFNSITPANGGIYYKNSMGTYTSAYPVTTTPADSLYINTVTPMTATNASYSMYRSGKSYTINETPAFKYGFYTFQNNADEGETTLPPATLGIGFEIPYVDFATPAVHMQSFTASPTIGVNLVDNNPFYYKYTFNIPGGLPGPFFTNIKTVQVQTYMDITPTAVPTIYDIDKITYDPGSDTPYIINTTTPVSDFNSPFVLTGNFKYPVTGEGWITATEQIYLGDVSAIQHATATFVAADRQYHLKLKYNSESDDYFDVGPVGPQAIGPFATKISGTYNDNNFPYITPTSTGPGPLAGNLGILATKDVDVPVDSTKVPKNAVYFYLWENDEWTYLGQETLNTTDAYVVNTTLPALNSENSFEHPVELFSETAPSDNTNIDSFNNSGWNIPWK